jgi:3-phenylpropionate/trans-cinnamate dioxygenase ferredoxin reductase subunit
MRLVIVGGSYAGLNAAAAAREAGFDGTITLVSAEPLPPYQRPPLSKGFLKGQVRAEDLALKGEGFYRDNAVDLALGRRAETLDLAGRRIVLEGGVTLPFDRLVLACGARPRPLPMADAGVAYLRTFEDAVRLREQLEQARSVAVLGGGFIGLEVASAAATLGKAVRVVEAGPRLLARSTPPEMAKALARRHERAGVEFLWGAADAVSRREVRLADGRAFDCDLVVAGLGAAPNVELAAEAGLAVDDGIETDEYGRTSVAEVFAVGDCSRHLNLWAGRRLRLESVQNAVDQARAAGSTLAGRPAPYRAPPRFWSDQYELKLQMTGLWADADATDVSGGLDRPPYSLTHVKDGAVIGVTSLNDPAAQVRARRALAEGPAPMIESRAS